MRNSKGCKGVLAVAAVAVAGICGGAGTAWGQPNNVVAAATGTLKASIYNSTVSYLETNGNTLADEDLIGDIKTAISYGPAVGNLGQVRVRANGGNWDVQMKTNYGGRLYLPGAPKGTTHEVCKKPGTPPFFADKDSCTNEPDYELGEFLKYSNQTAGDSGRISGPTSTADTVILRVGIGLAISSTYTGSASDTARNRPWGELAILGYSASNPDGTPTVIDTADLKKSASDKNAFTSPPGTPVSFAKYLGSRAASGGYMDNTQLESHVISAAESLSGWGSGSLTAAPTNGFPATDDWLFFYVNAAISQANYDKIGRNKGSGNYTETFTFTLAVDY
jgi:hypothetical protein